MVVAAGTATDAGVVAVADETDIATEGASPSTINRSRVKVRKYSKQIDKTIYSNYSPLTEDTSSSLSYHSVKGSWTVGLNSVGSFIEILCGIPINDPDVCTGKITSPIDPGVNSNSTIPLYFKKNESE